MRLTLIIPSLGAGGAERVLSILANNWAERGWDITLITLDDGSVPPFFTLSEQICHCTLRVLQDSPTWWHAIFNNLIRIRRLRKTIEDNHPDAVISLLDTTNVLTLVATRGLRIPVIVAEHIDPAQYQIKPIWNALRRFFYPFADSVVVLTHRALAFFPASITARTVVIPNPVIKPSLDKPETLSLPHGNRIVALGRLVKQKGFDLLLEAFSQLSERYQDWYLVILGEGPERPILEAQCRQLGLQKRVFLPGQVPYPEAVLSHSALFVLPSRFEGFPMALCEAMACGLPVIAADCPTGPREIIREGKDGLLVPTENPKALAEMMDRLMSNELERQQMGKHATEIVDRFHLKNIMEQWDSLVNKVIDSKSTR